MKNNLCANFGCGKPAAEKIKLSNGTVQNRCRECYEKKLAAMKRVKK